MFTEAKGDPYFFERGVNPARLRASFPGDVQPARKTTAVFSPDKRQSEVWKAIVDTARATNVPAEEHRQHF